MWCKRENLTLDRCVCEETSSQLFLLCPLPNASLSGRCHQCCWWCHRCVLWLPNALPFISSHHPHRIPPHRVCCLSSWSGLRSEGTQEVPVIRLVKIIPFPFERDPGRRSCRFSRRRAAAAALGSKRAPFKEATTAATASVSSAVTATNFRLLIHWCFSSLLPRLNQQWLG